MAVNPKIDIFEAKRAKKVTDSTTGETQVIADEEGTSLLFSIKTSFGNDTGEGYTDYLDFGFYIIVYELDKWSGGTRVGSKDILPNDPILTDLRNGVTDSFIIGDIPSIIGQTGIVEINGSKSYTIAADLTNGSEHSYFNVSIPFSFVNMHLSASSSGGIAFGKYLENAGCFECNYPTRLYSTLKVDGNQENYGSLYVKNNFTDVAVFEGNGIRVRNSNRTQASQITPTGVVAESVGVGSGGLQLGNANVSSSEVIYGPLKVHGKIQANELDNIDCGVAGPFNISANKDNIAYSTVYFDAPYSAAPIVVVTLVNGTGENLSKCQAWITAINSNYFQFAISNAGVAAKSNIYIYWMAYYSLSAF